MSKEETPELAEKPKRPKMTLDAQAAFLSSILRRCMMHTGDQAGQFAGEALLTLTTDDMLRLETVQQTLAIFDANKADDLVRQKIWDDMKRRKK